MDNHERFFAHNKNIMNFKDKVNAAIPNINDMENKKISLIKSAAGTFLLLSKLVVIGLT